MSERASDEEDDAIPDERDRTAFGARMRKARKDAGLTQKQVAKAVGLSQSTIAEMEKEGQGTTHLPAFSFLYNRAPLWLATGEGPMSIPFVADSEVQYASRPDRRARPAWVVGKGQGGFPERVWTDGDQPVGATDQYALVHSADPQAFLCKVTGDSMHPRYMAGEYALVEPNSTPDIEDDVLVRLTSGETMLKRLLSRRGGIRLGSWNNAEVLNFEPGQVSWIYYVAHPVPSRKIQHRLGDTDTEPTSVWGDL